MAVVTGTNWNAYDAATMTSREIYGRTLAELGKHNEKIVGLTADLAKTTAIVHFAKAFPDRFYNVGIAEQNMFGIAAGLAKAGLIPFASTMAIFACMRAGEQIRTDIAYQNLPVKIIATHAGISFGHAGTTHHCTEDFAIMRAIPGMLVLCPCDGNEMRLAVEALVNYEGPAYMRLGRLAVETVTDSIPGYKFELGKGATLRDGTDVTIIAVGMNVQMALAAADKLAAEGVSARVIDMHTIKPLDTELVLKAAKETGAIVTTEEANVLGGLGAAVAEYLSENYPVPVVRHGVNDEFGRSGKAPLVLDAYGVNADGIVAKVKQALAMKK